jgi:hypothetical protein
LNIENILNINYKPSTYKKDFMTYYIFKKKMAVIEIFIIIILAFLIWAMIHFSVIERNWSYLPIILISIGFLLFVFELYNYLKVRNDIIKKSEQLPDKTEKIIFYGNRIEFTFFEQTGSIFFSQLKKINKINGTLFLITKNKNDWPFRLNPIEIQELNLNEIKQLLEAKI